MSSTFEKHLKEESLKDQKDRPVGRIFSVLQAIQAARKPTTLSVIARETGLPKSTVHRMLAELGKHDVVRRQGDHYYLGGAVQRLTASRLDHATILRRAIKPVLVQLHARTRYVVGLGVSGTLNVKFADTIYDSDYSGAIDRIEDSSFLLASAAGKILLAYDHGLLMEFASLIETCSPKNAILRFPENLGTELSEIRRRKISHSTADANSKIAATAIPVFDADQRIVAALSIGAYRDRFDSALAHGLLRRAGLHAHIIMRQQSLRLKDSFGARLGEQADQPLKYRSWGHP